MRKEFLEVGKIVAPHGLKGEVKIECWCDSPLVLCGIKNLIIQKSGERITTQKSHVNTKNQTVIKFEGIDTADSAEKLRGQVLLADRHDILKDDDSYFIQDIIGMSVFNADSPDICYGTVTDVFSTGANDVYEITNSDNKKYLIPVIEDVVKDIDIDSETILIRPMKGMFDDDN